MYIVIVSLKNDPELKKVTDFLFISEDGHYFGTKEECQKAMKEAKEEEIIDDDSILRLYMLTEVKD